MTATASISTAIRIDDKLKLCRLLNGQISRFCTFQDLIDINSCAPIEVVGVHPIGHEAAGFDILLLRVNRRRPVFAGKLDDSPSFVKKAGIGDRHNRVDLLLLGGLKDDLQIFGIGWHLDLLQF